MRRNEHEHHNATRIDGQTDRRTDGQTDKQTGRGNESPSMVSGKGDGSRTAKETRFSFFEPATATATVMAMAMAMAMVLGRALLVDPWEQ
jgi:hypothetical protein